MPDEEEIMSEEDEGEAEIPQYEDLVTEVPERDVNLENYGVPKTISEEEEETTQKTDLQTAMKLLLPKYKNKRIDELLQPAMVSRIFPDNFMDKHFLITAFLIEEFDAKNEDVDVLSIISQVQDGLSVGYEGRGRIDLLEIAGVAHEEEMEKLSKEFGL